MSAPAGSSTANPIDAIKALVTKHGLSKDIAFEDGISYSKQQDADPETSRYNQFKSLISDIKSKCPDWETLYLERFFLAYDPRQFNPKEALEHAIDSGERAADESAVRALIDKINLYSRDHKWPEQTHFTVCPAVFAGYFPGDLSEEEKEKLLAQSSALSDTLNEDGLWCSEPNSPSFKNLYYTVIFYNLHIFDEVFRASKLLSKMSISGRATTIFPHQ